MAAFCKMQTVIMLGAALRLGKNGTLGGNVLCGEAKIGADVLGFLLSCLAEANTDSRAGNLCVQGLFGLLSLILYHFKVVTLSTLTRK